MKANPTGSISKIYLETDESSRILLFPSWSQSQSSLIWTTSNGSAWSPKTLLHKEPEWFWNTTQTRFTPLHRTLQWLLRSLRGKVQVLTEVSKTLGNLTWSLSNLMSSPDLLFSPLLWLYRPPCGFQTWPAGIYLKAPSALHLYMFHSLVPYGSLLRCHLIHEAISNHPVWKCLPPWYACQPHPPHIPSLYSVLSRGVCVFLCCFFSLFLLPPKNTNCARAGLGFVPC